MRLSKSPQTVISRPFRVRVSNLPFLPYVNASTLLKLEFSDSPNSIIVSSYEEMITQTKAAPPADPADLTDVPFINQMAV